MQDYSALEKRLIEGLGISRRPVAVAFRQNAPDGVSRFAGIVPSGCTFWRLAEEGRTFYTTQSDHYNCPIGSYTHSVPLPQDRAKELEQTLGLMAEVGYIRMEEIPSVFKLDEAPQVVIYSALADTPVEPDVVVISGRPGKLMLLVEAATRAGVASPLPLLARPTCMALPAALKQGLVTSAGCVGNRVYTAVGDDELYSALPGRHLEAVAQELETILAANSALAGYHSSRLQLLAISD